MTDLGKPEGTWGSPAGVLSCHNRALRPTAPCAGCLSRRGKVCTPLLHVLPSKVLQGWGRGGDRWLQSRSLCRPPGKQIPSTTRAGQPTPCCTHWCKYMAASRPLQSIPSARSLCPSGQECSPGQARCGSTHQRTRPLA